ncbi:RES family NAD+ phosphorylase [Clavibacter michiganensis]|uniref:RES family NAD+ phosphorylase n=1 Tax=Clavibacter michiganensis TaxID=28447 RepID=UPI00130322C5|nr:RES family NAD+ phosphorylase [Clavibacter michiganensis]MBF4637225.1 RES family NAD+ phosphorylase [Clavibacter michiganensis subsp. michiganensis]MDO4125892.1 RES family NAD+ phosphorylase [Clavibacter michiganensis]MDO4141238.1 RES family NAD+ phosphorylase [Clavibacter michiganensis]UDM09683.1 RES family NAD+ phosphorylase [Clavibacter michiganensis subsp. michiganensis]UDM12802.1 RES family NAD+ phosphorylase [Clavibacter michiganensis subsp. michiganensis]
MGESRIAAVLQNDWQIFSFTDSTVVESFLYDAVGSHALLVDGAGAVLRAVQGEADHLASWAEFSDEIKTKNRYFPSMLPDPEVLKNTIEVQIEEVKSDVALYRARLADTVGQYMSADMGAPPPARASAGRANPVGVPYLYLAFDEATCIYESRAASHAIVSVGKFQLTRSVRVLNLADVEAPDFFDDDEIVRLTSFRYMQGLSRELTKPVRASDKETDYIPTQYLCEFAKSIGLDGVLYSSALHPGGRNLVLFAPALAACLAGVVSYELLGLTAEWQVAEAA